MGVHFIATLVCIGSMSWDAGAGSKARGRRIAHFGCIHKSIVVKPDTADLVPRLPGHMDELVADPATITTYLVNREAGAI